MKVNNATKMKILIAVEDLSSARRLIDDLFQVGVDPKSEFLILHCVAPSALDEFVTAVYGLDEEDTLRNRQVEEAEDLVTEVAALLASTGPQDKQIHKKVLLSEPQTGIIETAKDFGAEQIIVASHGRYGVSRLFLDSVSEEVAQRAPCPVTIIKSAHQPNSTLSAG